MVPHLLTFLPGRFLLVVDDESCLDNMQVHLAIVKFKNFVETREIVLFLQHLHVWLPESIPVDFILRQCENYLQPEIQVSRRKLRMRFRQAINQLNELPTHSRAEEGVVTI